MGSTKSATSSSPQRRFGQYKPSRFLNKPCYPTIWESGLDYDDMYYDDMDYGDAYTDDDDSQSFVSALENPDMGSNTKSGPKSDDTYRTPTRKANKQNRQPKREEVYMVAEYRVPDGKEDQGNVFLVPE